MSAESIAAATVAAAAYVLHAMAQPRRLRIAVLECDVLQNLPERERRLRGGDTWGLAAQSWLERSGVRASFTHYQANVPAGQAPSIPSLEEFDALLVPGSAANVDQPLHWIAPSSKLVRQAHGARKKVLGICFGHQLIADALGGAQGKGACGMNFTVDEQQLTDEATRSGGVLEGVASVSLYKSHGNQVLRPPPGATVLASSALTPCEMFCVGENVLAMQGHPEFSLEVMQHILNRSKTMGDKEHKAQHIRAHVDGDAVGAAAVRWLGRPT